MTDRSADWLPSKLAVYLVADPDQTAYDLIEVVEAALANGVTAVQLRTKTHTDRLALELARAIVARCQAFDALAIINDRLDIALAAGATGIHLGVDDLPLAAARQLSPPGFILGYSPEIDEQAANAKRDGADYLGVGPVFGTVSKADAGAAIGLETVTRRAELANIPIIGIGGISSENASSVIGAGAVGVAVVGSILRAKNPGLAAADLVQSVRRAKVRIP